MKFEAIPSEELLGRVERRKLRALVKKVIDDKNLLRIFMENEELRTLVFAVKSLCSQVDRLEKAENNAVSKAYFRLLEELKDQIPFETFHQALKNTSAS